MDSIQIKSTGRTPIPLPRVKSLPELRYAEEIDSKTLRLCASIKDLSDNENLENLNITINNFKFGKKKEYNRDSGMSLLFYENIPTLQNVQLNEKDDFIKNEIKTHYDSLPKKHKLSHLPDLVTNKRNDFKRQGEPFAILKPQLSDASVNTNRDSDIISSSPSSSQNSNFEFTKVFVDQDLKSKKKDNKIPDLTRYSNTIRDSIEDYSYFENNRSSIELTSPRSSTIDSGIQNNDHEDSDIISESIFLSLNSNRNDTTHHSEHFLLTNFESENKVKNELLEDIIYSTAEIHEPKFARVIPNTKSPLVVNKKIPLEKKNDKSYFTLIKNRIAELIPIDDIPKPPNNYAIKLSQINEKDSDFSNTSSDEDVTHKFNSKTDFENFKADSSSEESENEITYDQVQSPRPVIIEDDDSPPPLPPRGYLIPKSEFQRPVLDTSDMKLKTNEEYKKETTRIYKNTNYTSFASLFQSKTYDEIQSTEERLRLIRRIIFCQSNFDEDYDDLLVNPSAIKPTFACNVDVTTHHSETVCKIVNDKEIEVYLTLGAGCLKYGIDIQIFEIPVVRIMNIFEEKIRRISKWSHVFEITWHDSNTTQILRIATRGEIERDTWMQRIYECSTSAFPKKMTNHFSRAGWLTIKEDESDSWAACWMLINEESIFYCAHPDEIVELNLSSIQYIVTQRMNNDIRDYLHIIIDFTDKFLYLQGISVDDTKQWEYCIRIMSKLDVKNVTERSEGTLYEEIPDLEYDKPPRVPFRPHGTKPEEEYVDSYDDQSENNVEISRQSENFSNMFITIHVGMFPSPVVTQVAIGPDTTAGDVQKRFGNIAHLRLQEYVLNGTLKRPLLPGEIILTDLLRWGQWDERDTRKNQLVLSECHFYRRARTLSNKVKYTVCGEVKFADTSKSNFKSYWMEYSNGKLRLYKHEMSTEKVSEWEVSELLWFVGHESNRNPNTQWSITFIQKENKDKRSKKTPYFGCTMGGNDNEDFVLWCAAFMSAAKRPALTINPALLEHTKI